jgi:RNA-directed DNA polymerase
MGLFKSLTRLFKRERTVADLAKWLDTPEAELRAWLGSRPMWTFGFEYTHFTIPKRRGGERTIEAPSDKLKSLQRRILHRLLNPLPVHAAATGFVRGRSIVDNARPHVASGVVINLDLADFFPTITVDRVAALFHALGWDAESSTILGRICTSDGHLPQGAPTSPAISNLVCRRMDARLAGLVVNQSVNLPRATRRRIRARQHRQGLGQLDAAGQKQLRGYAALLSMIEQQRSA